MIREVDATTGVISTVAGTGNCDYSGDGGPASAAALCDPTGVVLDTAGDLFIADYHNKAIRKVDASTGYISTVGGDGFAVAADAAGDVYVADEDFQPRL